MPRPLRRLRRLARRIARAVRAEALALATRGGVHPNLVLYESFAGNGALCNPEAIFREALAAEDLAALHHVWVLDDPHAHPDIRREFARDSRVRFVRYRSLRYFRALATSGYLVNNATFPAEFAKRPGQIYLNTWHGTPLKTMGYDMPNGALEAANTLRNFVAADYLLSQNPFMTERMYAGAYRLLGVFRGSIIEEGYPRADRQRLPAEARELLGAAEIEIGDRRIVLYAPTWKGESFSSPEDESRELIDATRELQRRLGDDHLVLLKTHQSVHRFAASDPEGRGMLVPNDIPTNAVLAATDVLVTDYSSIFFDFLATGRPIVFFTPDSAGYARSRGTYFADDELPGPICATVAAVTAAIFDDRMPARRQDWRARFAPADDGGSASRVVDIVLRGRTAGYHLRSLADGERIPILLYLGGMRSNGITTSALNLLRTIDHGRFDVSVVFARPRGAQQRANQALIDPRVRQFHRVGGMNGHKAAHLVRKSAERRRRGGAHLESPAQRRMWDREWARCFGDLRFAAVVDFSGYSAFWATLLLHSPGGTRSLWLHNDMASEVHRVIRGRQRMSHSLPAVFALYGQYDALVSVSPSLAEVNRRTLAAEYGLAPTAFLSARNPVDADRVLRGMTVPLTELDGHPLDAETAEPVVPDWVGQLQTQDDLAWFVTVGRFSAEKNQERLLRAFALLHAEHPRARLLFVGYGPLRSRLEQVIAQLSLEGAAFLAGPYANPFPMLAAADCFVLSSDYEGQPMVLLEAAIAGLPIVSVDFGSVRDALPEPSIRIADRNEVALADGMAAFLDGEVPPSQLDAVTYNAEVMAEFAAAVLSPTRQSA